MDHKLLVHAIEKIPTYKDFVIIDKNLTIENVIYATLMK